MMARESMAVKLMKSDPRVRNIRTKIFTHANIWHNYVHAANHAHIV